MSKPIDRPKLEGPLTKSLGLWQRINRYLLVAVFLVIILLPALFFGHPGAAEKALKENRRLAEFPRMSLFFFQHLEKWFTDNFGGRATLIYYGARWQMDWIGIPANRNVLLGRNQWLFYDQHYRPGLPLFADFRGQAPFSEEQLARIRSNLQQTQQALARCNIPFYLVMPPDKQTIYPDMMPFRRSEGVQTRADQLYATLSTLPGLRFVDLRPTLRLARQQEELPIYLKTDTHWNALGAFHGVQALMNAMGADGHARATAPRDAYEVTTRPHRGGDIAVSLLSLPDYFPDLEVGMTFAGDKAHAIDAEHLQYRNPDATGRLLLYGDSYSELMLPFLAQRFEQVTAVRRAQIDGTEITSVRADVVVLEVLERLLAGLEAPPVALPDCSPRP